MVWEVSYRDRDGRRAIETFEAASRDVVFKAIAAKGLRAIRVEAAPDKALSGGKASRMPKMTRIALLGMVISMTCAICILTLSNAAGRIPPRTKEPVLHGPAPSPAMREVTPSANAAIRVTLASSPMGAPAEDVIPPWKKIVEMISTVTNADGSVLERFRTADGKVRSRQSAPKPIFDTASDQLIAMAVSGAESGHAMPPMPAMDNADEAFIKSLENEITVNENDSDEVKALKRKVTAVREEVRQLMYGGRSFAEVIRDHRDAANHGVEMREEATRMVRELVDSGDQGAACECLERVNGVLVGMGMPRVEMPLPREERREQIRARHRHGDGH